MLAEDDIYYCTAVYFSVMSAASCSTVSARVADSRSFSTARGRARLDGSRWAATGRARRAPAVLVPRTEKSMAATGSAVPTAVAQTPAGSAADHFIISVGPG